VKRKALDRVCAECRHPKRVHGLLPLSYLMGCRSCAVYDMVHRFRLDNLKYLEEMSEIRGKQ
jgi:hypothetical protein